MEEMEEDEVEQERTCLLRDRLRIAVIRVAESEAQKSSLNISEPVMTAVCDITWKFTEQLAKELELFAHHAGRKSVNMDDVILAARRNEDVGATLRRISQDLAKQKEMQLEKKEKKRKKPASKVPEPGIDNHVVIE